MVLAAAFHDAAYNVVEVEHLSHDVSEFAK